MLLTKILTNHEKPFILSIYFVLKMLTAFYICCIREHNGSVVECLNRDRGAAGSSLTSIAALCPWARHINHSLVLVQLRKTRPYITERLLMGHKESNQTNKNICYIYSYALQNTLIMEANTMNPDQTAPFRSSLIGFILFELQFRLPNNISRWEIRW